MSWSLPRLVALLASLSLASGCSGNPTGIGGGGGGGGGPDTLPTPPANDSLMLRSLTYLGGSLEDMGRDVAADAQGNAYVSGSAKSANFPVTAGTIDQTYNASGTYPADAFATKVTPAGTQAWGTYLGGPNFERAYAIEVDDQGYVYLAGRAGAGFPTTAGALQTTFAGGSDGPEYGPQDGFVCKLNPTATQVIFCTYFGNSDFVPIRDIAVDANHDIYLVTSDSVGGFPSGWFANAYQKTIKGGRDFLVAKLKGDGSQVLWATYLGGSANEGNTNSIRVDASGVYVTGFTHSSDLPTPNGFDHTLGGPADVYLAKLSLDGSQLLWGTYIGGSGQEDSETHQMWVSPQGNVIVVGPTTSTDLPVTPGAYQTHLGGGGQDAFVAEFSSTGARIAITYLGGSGSEGAEGVATDSVGNIFVTGGTSSANFPTNLPSHRGGGTDAYLAKFSPDLSQLLAAAVEGGSANDKGRSLVVTATGDVLVTGQTFSPNLPIVSGFEGSFGGVTDGFLARFSKP